MSHRPTQAMPANREWTGAERSASRPAKGAVTPSATGMTISSSPARPEPSPAALEVEGHEEQDPEHDQVGQQPAGDPGAEARQLGTAGDRASARCTVASRTMNAPTRPTPTTRSPRIEGEVHPRGVAEGDGGEDGHDGREEQGEARSSRTAHGPGGGDSAGSAARPAIMPTRPNGTLTKKMSRHPPAARRKPPTVGPSASPTAWAAPWIPIALPSDGLGTASTMMATLFAWRSAAPTAWRARNPISHPRLGASPHSAEPMMKIPKP